MLTEHRLFFLLPSAVPSRFLPFLAVASLCLFDLALLLPSGFLR